MARFSRKDEADLREIRRMLSLQPGSFGFDKMHGARPEHGDAPLPTSEKEVNAFIESRTRLWRETWILPVLDRLIERTKQADFEGE